MPVFLQGRHTSIWFQSFRSLKNDPFYWLGIMKKIKKVTARWFLDFEGSGGDIAAGLRCIGSNSVVRKAVKRKPQQV
jgi:hypothetical protein